MRYAVIILCLWLAGSLGAAEQFVPFVIPARPNPDSLIGFRPEPIKGESDRLVVRSAHFYRGDERIRLWGVNLSFGANLPTHADAEQVAARLAAAGVNTVRLHHLDTSRYPRGWWTAKDGKTIEPEAFDKLDYFIDQLAKNGIYVNLNLHVGRAHSEYLDLPKSNTSYDKIINIFTPALVEAQKDLAREVLSRVNMYRNTTYADDPAIAIVEITNENSLFMWDADEKLRSLPVYYADILQKQYNGWLVRRYGSTARLGGEWSKQAEALGENLLKNGDWTGARSAAGVPAGWNLEQHSGCKAEAALTNYQGRAALELKPVALNGTDWHLQFNQGGFAVNENRYYTVSFSAAAGAPRSVTCNVSMAHEPWSNLGLSRRIDLTGQWQQFRLGFTAKAGDANVRVSFVLGGDKASVCLADVRLRPGGLEGLGGGERIEDASVRLYSETETPQRIADRMRFLAETEKTYFDDMRIYVKDRLGSKSLVTGTIVFGPLGLYGQSDMDFVDAHAYWQHPRFPGRPWDAGNWLIDQKPMTDHPAEAALFRLACERLAGKPFTVTEYNHPAPLDSQAECVPMIASFAAAQDWDGVWLYTYSHGTDDWDRDRSNSFFDVDSNPAKWGFMPAAAAIFRMGGVPALNHLTAAGLVDGADVADSLVALHNRYDRNMFGVLTGKAELEWKDLLTTQVASRLSSRSMKGIVSAGPPVRLRWDVDADKNGMYAVIAGGAEVFTGHAGRFGDASSGRIVVDAPDFAAVTMTALDAVALNRSKKILVTACGRCENTGMQFSEDRRTVGRNWGSGPVRIEAVSARIAVPAGRWTCRALAPDGTPQADVPVNNATIPATIQLSPHYKTMWYLLTPLQ
ncbi:MAG: carbohydrate binding domain-containing protein [Phycisphaerae bacterium]|nr:carbohydrate binding domain-containing protein [Phycisphaerae bacterium]